MIGTYASALVISAFVFGLLVVAQKVLLGIWACLDARERGISGDVGWGFVVALIPMYIGLIIYVVMRPTGARGNICPACKRPNSQDARFCAACGAAIEPVVADPYLPKRSRRVLVAFFICIGAAALLLVTMIGTSIAFSVNALDRVLPHLGEPFREWRMNPSSPDFQFDFHIGDGNNL